MEYGFLETESICVSQTRSRYLCSSTPALFVYLCVCVCVCLCVVLVYVCMCVCVCVVIGPKDI